MNSNRVTNFSAGPATLADWVLEKAAGELLNYQGSGMSVMEMSHRSKEFMQILSDTKQDLKDLLAIPDTHEVLFLQGGASLQFAMVPMNFATKNTPVDLIQSGSWTKKAAKEIKKFAALNIVASSETENFLSLPDLSQATFDESAAYTHICSNNTIFGTQFKHFPKTASPLVADMSSDILSRRINVSDFNLIFAGAQKNLGPSGVTLVILKKEWLEKANQGLPTMLSYQTHVDADSLYNTPPTYGIYMIGLATQWIKEQGGLDVIAKRNTEKAAILYDALDESDLFECPVPESDRSDMNVVFTLKKPNEALEKEFVKQAKAEGFVNLTGHRSIGGFRCSIYNAMEVQRIQKFVDFAYQFSKSQVLV